MRCRFVREIYHNKDNGFCIFVYHTEDADVPEAAKDARYKGKGAQFTARGTGLPDTDRTEADLMGKWVKNKYGLQLQVESYEEILPQTKEGIKGYLSSGMIKGIGPRTAELIVEKFGTRTFDVLDHYPDSLLEIKGITRKKLDAILLSYQGSHAMRDLAAYLTPFRVTPKKIQKIYEEFGNDALDTVKNQPFALCRISGFGFLTVDEIAKANKGKPDDPMRIEGCIWYCMEQDMQEGHLYQDKQKFQKKVYEQLNVGYDREAVTEMAVYKVLYQLLKEKQMYYESGALYPANMYGYECGAAKKLVSLLQAEQEEQDITFLLAEAQKELGISLSPKQEEGVRKAFRHPVSIITGGPGTGKTTVQKVLLYVNGKLGGGSVLLTAPTGRASRRMAESTGRQEAMTMHSALGLTSDEDSEEMEGMLEADFIIADEFTMSDMRLSHIFFDHIRTGSRLVLVGDVDQLPSVGPGNVFRELVQCGVIPVTVLDTIFRQAEGSRIIANAKRMQEDDAALDYGAGFAFIPAKSAEEAADKVQELYRASVDAFGMDNVQVLTPYRRTGEASVNALNERLWEMVNPKEEGKPEIRSGKRTFRLGDRIIHNKNKDQISNGDIGYIKNIVAALLCCPIITLVACHRINRYNDMRTEKGKGSRTPVFRREPCPGTTIKTWLLYQDMKWNTRRTEIFLIHSKEEGICPCCGSPLKYRDSRKRVHKIAGGGKEWYLIRRLRCSNDKCGRLHNELPDSLCPYKHYDAGLIEDVADGVVSEADRETEDYPCEGTMKHWRWWVRMNEKNMEGQIRAAAHRFLDMDGKFLKSGASLLGKLRERISPGWLKTAARAIYNSGGRIEPYPAAA